MPRLPVLATACAVALAALAAAADVMAQKYPSRPIRVIAPFPAGGALDIVARIVAQRLSDQFGQTAIVDNRAGAAGAIGSELAARAAPDGYTLLVGATATHGINPVLQKLSYDPVRDFAPVSLVATIPHVIVVHPSVPANTLQEFIAYAKTKRGLTYSSAGTGTPHHLAGEMLKVMAGLELTHVPYKGSAPAMADLIGGQVQFMSIEYTAAVGNIRGGKLRGIAVATAQRVPGIDLPTAAEGGLPGFEVTAWYAVFAPAGTPAPIVDLLSKEIARGLTTSETRERLAGVGATAVGSTPAELATHVKAEIARWSKVIKASGARVD